MNKTNTSDHRSVIERKDLSAVLHSFLAQNVPQLTGNLIREPVVNAILELFRKYCPPTDHMQAGQVLWYAVDKKETAGYGKRIEESALVPVTLDLISREDVDRMEKGMGKRERNQHAAARLFNQSYAQGGVLTLADAASIMRLAPGTVGNYVKEYEKTFNVVLPRRGTIHDMGPTLTHKRIICTKHYMEGKTIEQTARETNHSVSAVTRYIQDFRRVKTCLDEGWEVEKIRQATGLSISLVNQYVDMIKGKDLYANA